MGLSAIPHALVDFHEYLTPIPDGSAVVWTVRGIPKDVETTDNPTYVVGQLRYWPGDNRYIYKCVQAGTADTYAKRKAIANYSEPEIGKPFADGSTMWIAMPAGPMFIVATNVDVEKCTVFGGFGFAIHNQGTALTDSVSSSAYFSDFSDNSFFYTGGGIHVHGAAANGCTGHANRYFGKSTQMQTNSGSRMGTGEICIWDRAQGGSHWSGCYSQFGQGPGYVADAVGSGTRAASPDTSGAAGPSTWVRCRSENGLADIMYASAAKYGSGQLAEQSDSTCALFATIRSKGIKGSETTGGMTVKYDLQTVIGPSVRGFGIQAGNDVSCNNYAAWWKDKVNTTSFGTGFLGFGGRVAAVHFPILPTMLMPSEEGERHDPHSCALSTLSH